MRLDSVPWFRLSPHLKTWHAVNRVLSWGRMETCCGREANVGQSDLRNMPREGRCKVCEARMRGMAYKGKEKEG